jgi:Subtilisin-like serine proteases
MYQAPIRNSSGKQPIQIVVIAFMLLWYVITLVAGYFQGSGLGLSFAFVAQLALCLPIALFAGRNTLGAAAFALSLISLYTLIRSVLVQLRPDEPSLTFLIISAWIECFLVLWVACFLFSFWSRYTLIKIAHTLSLRPWFRWNQLMTVLALSAPFIMPWVVFGALGDPLLTLLDLLAYLPNYLSLGIIVWGFIAASFQESQSNRYFAAFWVVLTSLLVPISLLFMNMLRVQEDPETRFVLELIWIFSAIWCNLLITAYHRLSWGYTPGSTLLFWLISTPELVWTDTRNSIEILPFWIIRLLSPFVILGFTALISFAPRLIRRIQLSSFPTVAAFGLWACSASLYFSLGTPGFSPNGLVVVLKEQADLSGAAQLASRAERLEYVYKELTRTAEREQADLRAELERRGIVYRPYYLINEIEIRGNWWLRDELAARPDVAQVEQNPNVRPYRYTFPLFGDIQPFVTDRIQSSLQRIGVPKVWQEGFEGQGVLIAGADTGVEWDHPALKEAYAGWRDGAVSHDYHWFDAWDNSAVPWDDNMHGTHTIGTMVGKTKEGAYIGVAPKAQWIACRNMRNGLGNQATYLACMEYFLAPYPHNGDPFHDGDPSKAPHLINNSWGCPRTEGCWPEAFELAVEHLRTAGILMVVSAGNSGDACESIDAVPASYSSALTVGSIDNQGQISTFSSRGPVDGLLKPDITAPGEEILSSVPGGGYATLDGTSMAAPHISGVVALMISAQPSLADDLDRLIDTLLASAIPQDIGNADCTEGLGTQQPNNTFGYGLVDAYRAIKLLQTP